MKRSVRIYRTREDCVSCGRWVVAKTNAWIPNVKHNIPSIQIREMQKRRSLLMLKTIKKTNKKTRKKTFVTPNKCVEKTRM